MSQIVDVTEDTDLDLIEAINGSAPCDFVFAEDGAPASSKTRHDCTEPAVWIMAASCGHDAFFCGPHAALMKAELLSLGVTAGILCMAHRGYVRIEWRVL